MKTFTDNAGRDWMIAVNVTAIKHCRALAEVDLYGLVSDGFAGLGAFLADPIKLVDVLYVLCKDQAEARGLSDEDFGRSLFGDAIARATDAFCEEYTAFFPDPRVRAGLVKVIAKSKEVRDRLMDVMDDKIDRLDPDQIATELRTKLERLDPDSPAKASSEPSGDSPASSESTPDPSPSASST